MEMNKNMIEDDKLKALLSGSKLEASENLKFRIMQQIRTENSLSKDRAKIQKTNIRIRTVLTLTGVMYFLMAVIALFAFLHGGKLALMSDEFLMSIVFVAVVSMVFGAISFFDINRNFNKKREGN